MARQRQGATGTRTGASVSSSDSTGTDQPDSTPEREGRPWGPGSKPAAGLYLVATPIGNLRDITLRALDVLGAADLVACEDTRVTGKLLRLLGLKASLFAYHDHNAEAARPALLARLEKGQVIALVSDAGTPLVSDPGYRLVRACIERNIPVTSVPGASAALSALQLSGLASDRFLFTGFLPSKAVARRAALKELESVEASLVIYESPHRVAETLSDMVAILGERPGAVARELTKMHEEVVRGPLPDLAARYGETPPRGEVVIVVGPPVAGSGPVGDTPEIRLAKAVDQGLSLKDASALVAAETGLPRREIYALALRLFRGGNEE